VAFGVALVAGFAGGEGAFFGDGVPAADGLRLARNESMIFISRP
jgi:hypothetical protein